MSRRCRLSHHFFCRPFLSVLTTHAVHPTRLDACGCMQERRLDLRRLIQYEAGQAFVTTLQLRKQRFKICGGRESG